jgi:hypothetical protein
VGADGRYEWNVGDGTNRCDYDGPAGTMNDGKWHHVAFSLSRGTDGLVTLFFDGKVVGRMPCVINTVSSGEFVFTSSCAPTHTSVNNCFLIYVTLPIFRVSLSN